MYVKNAMREGSTRFYTLQYIIYFSLLLLFLSFTSYYLIKNYFSQSFLNYDFAKPKVYFLNSPVLEKMHKSYALDRKRIEHRVEKFKELCKEYDYVGVDINVSALNTIPKNSILIALDMMALSKKEVLEIDNFVQNGGKIVFNYTSGFLDGSFQNNNNNLVKEIASLEVDQKVPQLTLDANKTGFLSTRLFSPVTQYLPEGRAYQIQVYDTLPVFKTPKGLEADAYLTNWLQTDYLKNMTHDTSGLIWHGIKGKGKWVYFSFPSYVFVDNPKYAELFHGMLEYLKKDVIILPYPYIDAKNALFVSEDTEYRFENLDHFSDVSLNNKFPVTAFCVAKLAKEHKELMQDMKRNPYLEIASHSYDHNLSIGQSDAKYKQEIEGSKEILHALSTKKIIGFRAPREESDTRMLEVLENSGYKYLFDGADNRLATYYKKDLLIIPKHGMDDYSLLVNIDLTNEEILHKMMAQAAVVTSMDGIFTLSTHSHLMSYGANIKMLDDFLRFVQLQKQMVPMNAQMIYKRLSEKRNLDLKFDITLSKVIVTVLNSNDLEVKNTHYDIWVDPSIELKNVESEIIGVQSKLQKTGLGRYTLILPSIRPRSQTLLFLNYVENK